MFFDLNLAEEDLEDLIKRELLATSIKSGYSTLCTNRIVSGELKAEHKSRPSKIEFQSLVHAIPGVYRSLRCQKSLLNNPHKDLLRHLKRLTVEVSNASSHLAPFSNAQCSPVISSYDIVAVYPTNLDAFNRACTTENIDIISLNFYENFFAIKAAPITQAISKGIHFEICYSPALRSPAHRMRLFANVRPLIECTKGRNLIISSGGSSPMTLRTPYDIINFCSLIGMKEKDAMDAILHNCIAVVKHGEFRKDKTQFCIDIEDASKLDQPIVATPHKVWEVPEDWGVPDMDFETPNQKRKRKQT